MGRHFGILIWTLMFVSMKGQVLFDDMGDRHRSGDFMKIELRQIYQGIERIAKQLDGMEKIVETIVNNIVKEERTSIRNTSVQPTMKDENFGDILSAIQTEQRLLRQEMAATRNLTKKADEKISDLLEKTRDAMVFKGTETKTQKGNGLQNALQAGTNIDKANEAVSFCTNKMAEKFGTNLQILQDGIENFTVIFENKLNTLDKIRNTSLYLSEQFLSGDDIIVLRFNKSYEEMSSQFLLTLPIHDLNFTAKREVILGNDCADILKKYPNTRGKNGVYNIMGYSNSSITGKAKAVYCDMTTDNGGWTVIQRRVNGTVAFYRDWKAYKNGFGIADHEFWIGNDMLHRLTSLRPQELRVDMQKFKPVGSKTYAVFSQFSVGDEARDSLTKGSNNMKFSTADQDNDNSTTNCADKYKTAGWLKSCFTANINGLYSNHEKKYDYSYLTWGYSSSLKTFQMMIRPHA